MTYCITCTLPFYKPSKLPTCMACRTRMKSFTNNHKRVDLGRYVGLQLMKNLESK